MKLREQQKVVNTCKIYEFVWNIIQFSSYGTFVTLSIFLITTFYLQQIINSNKYIEPCTLKI
jgi:hypothetical protein